MKSVVDIFNIKSDEEFKNVALQIYEYQRKSNPVYSEFVDLLKWPEPKGLSEIPFLPIEFFKTKKVVSTGDPVMLRFKSSGTGGDRSSHYISDPALYHQSFSISYRQFIGEPEDQIILALLPNYLEQGDSSLVYMVEQLIRQSKNEHSGFVLNEFSELFARYDKALKSGKQVVIFGVSYALLDLSESERDLNKAIIIETGGMKGRRKELTKAELHSILSEKLKPNRIFSEYGMTELLSQAYCSEDLIFKSPAWMKVLIRDVNDPFSYLENGKTGGINIIDLANMHSCSFIATQDLGKITNSGFEIVGRFDNSEIRGCNLLVQ